MKRIPNAIMAVAMLFALGACSAHSPFIGKNMTDVTAAEKVKYPAHTKKVFVTTASLPATVKHEVLGTVDIGKAWYGSAEKVKEPMADGGRELGADAVVEMKTWFQPSGWAWAAPHGSGKAVKITDPAGFDFATLEGEWK